MSEFALQGKTFVILCLGGLFVGFLFDLYSAFRSVFRVQRGLLTNIGDLFYWLIVTVVVYALLFITRGGEVRLYMFAGVGLGVWIYERLLRTGFSAFLHSFTYRICRLLRKLGRLIGFGMPQALLMGFFVYGGHGRKSSCTRRNGYRKKM